MKKQIMLTLLLIVVATFQLAAQSANRKLGNLLSPTTINKPLLPKYNDSIDLGSSSIGWRNLYLGKGIYFSGIRGIFADSLNTSIGLYSLYTNSTGGSNTAVGFYNLYSNTTGNNNTAVGSSSLINNTIGGGNSAFGEESLVNNTSGNSNSAFGNGTLYQNTTGYNNTGIGNYTLTNNTTGVNNTAAGKNSLLSNTTGNFNTANGYGALAYNTTASNNTGIGDDALLNNTTGNNNTANGAYALFSNATGYSNVAIGIKALYKNVSGHNLVAIGDSALFNQSANSSNYYNIAIGSKALYSNTIGYKNTANGYQALYFNTDGIGNTANGAYALNDNSTGVQNTADGWDALFSNTIGNQNTALGSHTDVSSGFLSNAMVLGYAATVNASNKVVVGNTSVTVIGGQVGWSVLSDGRFKKDIQQNVPGLVFINKLKPITYHTELEKFEKFLGRKDSTLNVMKPELQKAEQKLRTGFIAQDVEKAAKDINYDFEGVNHPQNNKDNYSLIYADFVPSLVKAVQELSAQNDELKKRLDKLESIVSTQSITNAATIEGANKTASTFITVYPNPTKDILYIQSKNSANFSLSDANGKMLITKQIHSNGSLDVSKLSAGTYFLRNDVSGDVQKVIIAR